MAQRAARETLTLPKPVSVDRGVPVPTRTIKYPFRVLEIGDSFFVPDSSRRMSEILAVSMSRYGKALGRAFVKRKVPGGHRVWRVSHRDKEYLRYNSSDGLSYFDAPEAKIERGVRIPSRGTRSTKRILQAA